MLQRRQSHLERRQSERYDCYVKADVETKFGLAPCTIINISTGGLAITVDPFVKLSVGEKVKIIDEKLGKAEGVVRWAGMGKFGLELSKALTPENIGAIVGKNLAATE